MLKVSLKIEVNLSTVLLGVIGVSAGISACQYIFSRNKNVDGLNSSNVDCNTKNNDGIKLEARRNKQAQKENEPIKNSLDCDISENKMLQSKTSKINSSNVVSNTENKDDIKLEEGKDEYFSHN